MLMEQKNITVQQLCEYLKIEYLPLNVQVQNIRTEANKPEERRKILNAAREARSQKAQELKNNVKK